MKNKLHFFLAAVLAVLLLSCTDESSWKGMPAPDVPEQNTTDLPEPFKHNDCLITPLANYRITAIVLNAQAYDDNYLFGSSPMDLLLGWQKMSTSEVIKQFDFRQRDRSASWITKSENFPIPQRETEVSLSLTHCVPESKEIEDKLSGLKKYDLVLLEGYLISMQKEKCIWRSSLTREDVDGNASEILFVTDVVKMKKT